MSAVCVLDAHQLTGRSSSHVASFQLPDARAFLAHPQAAQALQQMAAAAHADGIELAVASAFRSFDAQALIWGAKWRGERPLFDAQGAPIAHAALDDAGRVAAILEWSALPGASRHHWGSEFDLFDRAAMPADYRPHLMPYEYSTDGIFNQLSQWLDAHMERFAFFRPYDCERGGIHVEPWHLSYAPIAVAAQAAMTEELIAQTIAESDLPGKTIILEHIADIHARQVCLVGDGSHLV